MRRRLAGAPVTGGSANGRATGRRTSLTARAAVLAVVLCAVAVTLAYPLREFLSQRSEISHLEQQQRDGVRSVAAMERAYRQWSDPDYVRAQARQRLHFVVPGQPAYAVLLPPSPPRTWSPVPGGAVESTGPWYGRLWSSVEAAGGTAGGATGHR